MSVVTLQLGQCGNQLGEELFNSLYAETAPVDGVDKDNSRSVFFSTRDNGITTARSCLIDMEPKVVNRCLLNNRCGREWVYDKSSSYCKESGSGNNWGHGYAVHGPASAEHLGEVIRKQVEVCDRLDAFLLLQSTAGGTGSGLGSYCLELVSQDLYPRIPTMSVALCPFLNGEVSVQYYNSAFSISAAAALSDVAIVVSNSELGSVLSNTSVQQAMSTSFVDLNRVLARQLSHQLLPASGGVSGLINHLSAHPYYNIATCRLVPQISDSAIEFSSDSWQGLYRGLAQMFLNRRVVHFSSKSLLGNCAVSANLCLRGDETGIEKGLDLLKSQKLYWRQSVDPLRITIDGRRRFGGFSRTASFLSVDQTCIEPITGIISKAKEMANSGAFLHQYATNGVGTEDLSEALLSLYEITLRYKQLSVT